MLQAKLGIHGCPAFDVQAVCSGFVYALTGRRCDDQDRRRLEGARRRRRKCSRASSTSRDRTTCVLFGDGAGAVVLEASETPGILASELHADGRHVGILCVPGNGLGRQGARRSAAEDGRSGGVQARRRRCSRPSPVRCSPRPAGPSADIDWLIPHQANIRIMQSTAKKLKLAPEKLIVTVDRHGNTSAASIPLALDDAGPRAARSSAATR